jgi:DNA invertase Pin-like site-specific DNA recombinase
MHGQSVGYIRVSTVDQHTERQLEASRLTKPFSTKPQAKIQNVRSGDTVIVHSMDRLARR